MAEFQEKLRLQHENSMHTELEKLLTTAKPSEAEVRPLSCKLCARLRWQTRSSGASVLDSMYRSNSLITYVPLDNFKAIRSNTLNLFKKMHVTNMHKKCLYFSTCIMHYTLVHFKLDLKKNIRRHCYLSLTHYYLLIKLKNKIENELSLMHRLENCHSAKFEMFIHNETALNLSSIGHSMQLVSLISFYAAAHETVT